jgi:ABC-type transport system involved in cytochrome bd biosynthesis fused ATPase/permease subunit
MMSLNEKSEIILNGNVSYVSQVPWIQNDTLRNNILFNSEYNEGKYNYVLDICELRPDLEILVGGDMTEIGEKGINLSGGQKARISIARALYADSDLFFFDDPISALDAHVGASIMKKCLMGYLENKTRILVTHALQYLSGCDRIIYMNNGEIKWQGTYDEILNQDFFVEFSLKLKKQESTETSLTNVEKIVEEKFDYEITLKESKHRKRRS